MSQQELLKLVAETLERVGIDYMLTGSLVSSLQGEPRSTHDIDIVVQLKRTAAKKLSEAFTAPRYHISKDSILNAISDRTMFNLMDTDTGGKVDFWILTDEPFDKSRFERRRTETALGVKLTISSPEDTILVKLHWAKRSGGSEKQFTDALRVYEVQFGSLDLGYLRRWSKALGVDLLLKRLENEAKPI